MRRDTGCRAKDRLDRCHGCGEVIQRQPGRPGRPRHFCASCCPQKPPPERPPVCVVCGGQFPPPSPGQRGLGNVRLYCSPECKRRVAAARERARCVRACVRCGATFRGSAGKQFCSDSCRWPERPPIQCVACGVEIKSPQLGQRCCSKACVGKLTAERNKARGKRFTCLNCNRLYHPKNRSRCSFKYCSRDCAFEARRLKKPCAARPLELGAKLAAWFLAWGGDYFPHVYKCCECGAALRHRKDAPRLEKCLSCRSRKDRVCVDCGSPELAVPLARRCELCRRRAKDAAKKRGKKKGRRVHGSDSIRSRCRRHNAPYTPVSRKKILDRDDWMCQLCGMRLLPRYTRLTDGGVHGLSPTIDHIIPLARGPDGPGHVESNCQAACFGCNAEKRDTDPDSFAVHKATGLDSKAWQKAQHQRRSTSSRCEDQRKPTTARSLAPL